jgi:hypothetical protein
MNTSMVQLVTKGNETGLERSPVEKSTTGTLADFAHEEDTETSFGSVSVNRVYLHDHRTKDDLDQYRERIAGSE